MSGKRLRELLKHLNLTSLCVPILVVVASITLPFKPILQQILIGILLVWFYALIITGFPLWK